MKFLFTYFGRINKLCVFKNFRNHFCYYNFYLRRFYNQTDYNQSDDLKTETELSVAVFDLNIKDMRFRFYPKTDPARAPP